MRIKEKSNKKKQKQRQSLIPPNHLTKTTIKKSTVTRVAKKTSNKTHFQQRIQYLSTRSRYIKPSLSVSDTSTDNDSNNYKTFPTNAADFVKLDSNENYVIPKQFQQDVLNLAKKNVDIRKYPLGGTERLISALSKHLKIPANCIGLGNGADQILDLILANFCSKNTKVLLPDPTFEFILQRCNLYDIPMVKIPFLSNMTLDINNFYRLSPDSDVLYLDSPNNPTGFQFNKKGITNIINDFEDNGGFVIIDEAYGEFGEYSLAGTIKNHKNLIVVKTFSKSYGLAGLRLGYVISNPDFIDVFNNVVQYPYPINTLAIESGIYALQELSKQMSSYVVTIKQQRKRIIDGLREYGDAFTVYPSYGNFVLFDAKGADKRIHTALLEQGISIRHLGKIGSARGCLRVTVGTPEMNSKFLLAIRDLLR